MLIEDRDVLKLPWKEVRQLRGEEIAYVPQDPASALNPSIRIGKQIVELLELRGIGTAESRLQGARDGLAEVGLPNDDEFLKRYAHQLSGGQVQRVALAMAFLPKPKVLVLDEPTTGLDVTTQKMVLDTMAELCRAHGVSALYVTHDLAVVANIADRVAVMYAGQIAELGPRDDDLRQPGAPLHAGAARLDPAPEPGPRPEGHPGPHARRPGRGRTAAASTTAARSRSTSAASRCPSCAPSRPDHEVRCIRVEEIGTWDIHRGTVPDADPDKQRDVILSVDGLNVFYGRKEVVHDVTFDVAKGEVVALVGESGSGKTTISRSRRRAAQGVDRHHLVRGPRAGQERSPAQRRGPQADPVHLPEPLPVAEPAADDRADHQAADGALRARQGQGRPPTACSSCMEQVALGSGMLHYQASRLSGGERQRVAIARALAAEPDVMICDEITSALDVSVQGSIVALLEGLRQERGISMLFVTHNLALVRSIAARVEILQAGRVVEAGSVVEVMETPQEEYTRKLLSNSPSID